MSNYYDIVQFILLKIFEKKPRDLKSFFKSMSENDNVIKQLIADYGVSDSQLLLADILKELIDEEIIIGNCVPVKSFSAGGFDNVYSIERLSPKGLIFIKKMKEISTKKALLDSIKKEFSISKIVDLVLKL